MEITEVRIKLNERRDDKLRAFCSVTVDNCFVIRDLKIIDGTQGLFVAMPSRKLTDRCPRCGGKNHLRARFCNDCGATLNPDRGSRDPQGPSRLHVDIAHPIHSDARDFFQKKVIQAYEQEVQRAQQPGYKPVEIPGPEENGRGQL
jgi:stage V sporulation protein G